MSNSENLSILHEAAAKRNATPAMVTTLEHVVGAESKNWNRFSANPDSSARGLFQFLDSTWLGVLKQHGNEAGQGKYAPHIHQIRTSSGTFWTIDDPALKKQALDLRFDARIACEMGTAFTQDNRQALLKALGKEPTAGELYLAHFLGDSKAAEVLKQPLDKSIRELLSAEAINANRGVRLKRGGRETYFQDFTVGDIQLWAAGKMDQPLNYEQLSQDNRQRLWRQKHKRDLKPGEKDDYSDMSESLGDMVMSVINFIGMCITGVVTAIGSIFKSNDDSLTPPLPTPPTSQVAAIATTVPSRST